MRAQNQTNGVETKAQKTKMELTNYLQIILSQKSSNYSAIFFVALSFWLVGFAAGELI